MKVIALKILLIASVGAEPAFVGYMTDQVLGTRYAVVLASSANAQWVKIGETVEDFVVIEYLSTREVLVLLKGDRALLLKLKSAKVADGSSSNPAVAEGVALLGARRKLLDAQDRLKRLREEREKALAERKIKGNSSTKSNNE